MDRSVILQHLNQARRHVATGLIHIARQRAIIARLEVDGHDTGHAEGALRMLHSMQAVHVADCDRLEKALREGQTHFSVEDDARRVETALAVTQESMSELRWYQAKIDETAQVVARSIAAIAGSLEILQTFQGPGPDPGSSRELTRP